MSEREVIALMESSKSSAEWNTNCDIVKAKCGGYPSFWFRAIILSGIGDRVAAAWGGDMQLHVTTF